MGLRLREDSTSRAEQLEFDNVATGASMLADGTAQRLVPKTTSPTSVLFGAGAVEMISAIDNTVGAETFTLEPNIYLLSLACEGNVSNNNGNLHFDIHAADDDAILDFSDATIADAVGWHGVAPEMLLFLNVATEIYVEVIPQRRNAAVRNLRLRIIRWGG